RRNLWFAALTRNHMVAYNRTMNADLDAIFKALDDPTRRLMLDELAGRGEMTLYELTARLTMNHRLAVSRQAVAKHLAILVDAGLVKSGRRGKFRVLSFRREPLAALQANIASWLETVR